MNIRYTIIDGAETISDDIHWNAQGHETVARRLLAVLVAECARNRLPAQQSHIFGPLTVGELRDASRVCFGVP